MTFQNSQRLGPSLKCTSMTACFRSTALRAGTAQAASSSARRASLLHHKIKDVEHWMRCRQLPRSMQGEVTSYYANIWVASAGGMGSQ